MSPRTYICSFVFLCFLTILSAQKRVDLRLSLSSQAEKHSCFSLDLRAPFGEEIWLAGQNYRLFYDASRVSFMEGSLKTYLNPAAYTAFELRKEVYSNIGFVSISTDGKDLNKGVIRLPRSGEWVTTGSLCFESSGMVNYDLTWARMDKTSHFASASVAFSEWVNEDFQQVLDPNEVIDYSYQRTPVALDEKASIKLFPNPTADFINVELSTTGDYQNVIIKDVIGREVIYDVVNAQAGSTLMYDLTNWPDGFYTVEVLGSQGQMIYKDNLVKVNK